MGEHGHARLFLDAGHQALAPARHDHVDGTVKTPKHQADGLTVGGGYELNRAFGEPRLAQAAGEADLDGAAGVMAVGTAEQDGRVTGLGAETTGIRGTLT